LISYAETDSSQIQNSSLDSSIYFLYKNVMELVAYELQVIQEKILENLNLEKNIYICRIIFLNFE